MAKSGERSWPPTQQACRNTQRRPSAKSHVSFSESQVNNGIKLLQTPLAERIEANALAQMCGISRPAATIHCDAHPATICLRHSMIFGWFCTPVSGFIEQFLSKFIDASHRFSVGPASDGQTGETLPSPVSFFPFFLFSTPGAASH